ncbi:MAG: DUF4167 domain-containing protein [Alphaproteobacteria bacterium]
MRQSGPQRRGRGRPSGRRGYNNSPNRSYDSNGPEVKIRGTASTVNEKYQALARDALIVGDRVAAENYFQHAEHYFRVMQAAKPQQTGDGEQRSDQRGDQRGEQRDNRGRGQQNRVEPDDEAAMVSSDEEKSPASDDGVADAAAEIPQTEEPTADAAEVEGPAHGQDGERPAPMNPADLAAMSESGRTVGDDAHGANGQDNDGAEQPEPAPRRQPRRRRRQPEAAVSEMAATETEETATTVVEDVEPG